MFHIFVPMETDNLLEQHKKNGFIKDKVVFSVREIMNFCMCTYTHIIFIKVYFQKLVAFPFCPNSSIARNESRCL